MSLTLKTATVMVLQSWQAAATEIVDARARDEFGGHHDALQDAYAAFDFAALASALAQVAAHIETSGAAIAFVDQFANFTPYIWDANDGYSDDQGGDAITSMNDLIASARELLGLPALDKIGEQEQADE